MKKNQLNTLTDLEKAEIINLHQEIFKSIEIGLKEVDSNIFNQFEIFKKSKSNKKYRRDRNDKNYLQWKKNVIERFKGHCCICQSNKKIVVHHLYSYKYYLHLRTNLDNGVCLCRSCHIKFHDQYDNRNISSHFFEFIEVMKDSQLQSYLAASIRVSNITNIINGYKRRNEIKELIEKEHLKILVTSGNRIYSGIKNIPQPKGIRPYY